MIWFDEYDDMISMMISVNMIWHDMIWYDMMLTTLSQWLLLLSYDDDNDDDDCSMKRVYE